MHSGQSGAYVSIEQQLTGRVADGQAVDGITVFLNATRLDGRTFRIRDQISLGAFWCGLLLRGDTLAVALGRPRLNPRFGSSEEAAGREGPTSERAMEIFYRVRPTSWLTVQPGVQWIDRPGGYRSAKGVGIVGIKSVVTL